MILMIHWTSQPSLTTSRSTHLAHLHLPNAPPALYYPDYL
jgi:hypothetical protein